MGRVSEAFPNVGVPLDQGSPAFRRSSGGSGDPRVGYPQVCRIAVHSPHSPHESHAPQERGRAIFARFDVYVHNVTVPAGEDVSIDLPARGRGVSEEAS